MTKEEQERGLRIAVCALCICLFGSGTVMYTVHLEEARSIREGKSLSKYSISIEHDFAASARGAYYCHHGYWLSATVEEETSVRLKGSVSVQLPSIQKDSFSFRDGEVVKLTYARHGQWYTGKIELFSSQIFLCDGFVAQCSSDGVDYIPMKQDNEVR